MAIEVKGVTKRFGGTTALDNVSVTLGEQKIYGLLGNNGAGKTTLFNLITNRLYADSGKITIDGETAADNDRALGKIFMMGEQNLYPEDMRVKKAFLVSKVFYPGFDLDYANLLAEKFELNTKKKITSLSTGYASIFRLILALAVNTPYLLLDEPVLGLDARHRDMFYKLLIEKYARDSCTIVVSTHIIQEVANLIEHTLIIRDGKIIRDMPKEELLAGSYTVSGAAAAVEEYIKGKKVISEERVGGLRTACVEGQPEGEVPAGLELGRTNLQDYFISLMNGGNAK